MLSKLQPTCVSARRNPVPVPVFSELANARSRESYGSDVLHTYGLYRANTERVTTLFGGEND